jgi:hypothetical protein
LSGTCTARYRKPPTPQPSTGVDYLGLVMADHDDQLLGQIAYRDLPRTADEPRS